ncbi:hypothetical protein H4R18_000554 [Coemansia javaensis]|uniref:Uncharacterized protein n=1 Tax=Coemansia javaensis TaxID=2761396 RepID=A0A9W8LKE2_9FUNG|nr:hypothetical protein H4R18_000554 [Coemansia javaensis]
MVYDTVYDSMHDSNPRACQNTGVFTNLGLVSSVGYLHLVRRVDVILGSGGWPVDHSWAAFSADGDESQDIWFPHLRVLDLSCYREGLTDWTAETKPTGGLHFPALKVLKVVCEDEIPQVLERGVFPARLDLVVVLATPPVFLELSNMALPNARHFRLTPGLLWQPETVASASLTHLDVSTRIGVGTAAALIRRLPRLSSLHIRGLGAYDMPPDISVPEPNTYWLVAPISNTLRFVRILFSCNFLKPEPAAFALRYLLLAVPSLSIIKAHGIPGDPIDGFVDAYVDHG